jgi:hypothetical protein
MDQLRRLKDLGYPKERGAVALLVLCLFGMQYLLLALIGPPGWGAAFFGLALCYLVGFFGIAAEWFWARWFASGLGWSGLMVGIVGLASIGWHPMLALFGVLHGAIVLMLYGTKVSERYELRPDWRQRYGMDEHGVIRLGKAVTRGSASLPSLILWALAPKEGQALWIVALLAGAGGLLGLWGLLRLRTWGVAALAGAGVLASAVAVTGVFQPVWGPHAAAPVAPMLPGATALAAACCFAAVWPFGRLILRQLRAPRG